MKLVHEGQEISKPEDAIKDPFHLPTEKELEAELKRELKQLKQIEE